MPTPFTVIGMKDAATHWDGPASIYTSYVKSALLGALATIEENQCSALEGPNVIPSRHIGIWANMILNMIAVQKPWKFDLWLLRLSCEPRIRFSTETEHPSQVLRSDNTPATYSINLSGTWNETEKSNVYNKFVIDLISILQSPSGREIVGALYSNPSGLITEIYALKTGTTITSWDIVNGVRGPERTYPLSTVKAKNDRFRSSPGTPKSESYRIEASETEDGKGPIPGTGVPVEIYYVAGESRYAGSSPQWTTYPNTLRSDIVLLHELLHAYFRVFGLAIYGKFQANDLSFGPFHELDTGMHVSEYQVVGVSNSNFDEAHNATFHLTENQYRLDRNRILTPPQSARIESDGNFPQRTSYQGVGGVHE